MHDINFKTLTFFTGGAKIVVYLTSSCVKAHECQKEPNLHTNELNTTFFFLFDEPLKGSKSLKIFKISLKFRFDKYRYLSKSVHTGENSQILTVWNKNICMELVYKRKK
jgi:hypothetical protein